MRLLLLPVAVAMAATPAHAQKNESVVVMPLKSRVLKRTALAAIDELVVFSMAQLGDYKVVTKQDLDAELGRENLKEMMSCDSVKCAAEIGGALGTRFLLAGSVRKLGSKIIVSLALIDTKKGETWRGQGKVKNHEDLYEQAVNQAVRQVLNLPVAENATTASPPTSSTTPPHPIGPWPKPDWVGEVQQPRTNLVWLRCPMGMTWSGATCQGTAREMTWDVAQKACPSGYRVPTRDEYLALLGGCESKVMAGRFGKCNHCSKSHTCSSMFGQDEGYYWTSSSYADIAGFAWVSNFRPGSVFAKHQAYVIAKTDTCMVRCVRLSAPTALPPDDEIALQLLENEYETCSRLTITEVNPTPDAKKAFETSVRLKARTRDDLVKRFGALMERSHIPRVRVHAMCRIGDAYYDSVEAILAAPLPDTIQGVPVPDHIRRAMWRQLQELGDPSLSASTEAYKRCIELAMSNRVSSELVRRARKRIDSIENGSNELLRPAPQ
ncbi:DUF1566 domain-containing protein [Myxococcota bacterium]